MTSNLSFVEVTNTPMAEAANARGKACFQAHNYDGAITAWTAALDLDAASGNALAPKLYANRAAARLRLRDDAEAVEDCRRCLACSPPPDIALKARARLGLALLGCERYGDALATFEALPADGSGPLFDLVRTKAGDARRFLAAQTAPTGDGASDTASLFSDAHTLRLTFMSELPGGVVSGTPLFFRVAVVNEFGLYRVGMDACGSVAVTVVAPPGSTPTHPTVALESAATPLDLHGKASLSATLRLPPGVDSTRVLIKVAVHGNDAILPVLSAPTAVCRPGVALPDLNRLLAACRVVDVAPGLPPVFVGEAQGDVGIGGRLWDCGLVLSSYLGGRPDLVAGKTVLEVGAGTGIVGMACAALGAAAVRLSDLGTVVPYLEANIALNCQGDVCSAVALPWGTPPSDIPWAPDVVVAADVVYDPDHFLPLVTTLSHVTAPDAVVFLAHRERHPRCGEFFTALRSCFVVEDIPRGASGAAPDVTLYKCRRL